MALTAHMVSKAGVILFAIAELLVSQTEDGCRSTGNAGLHSLPA